MAAMLFLLSVVNGAILAPLPFPDGDRLVAIGQLPEDGSGVDSLDSGDAAALARELASFEAVGSYTQMTVNLGHAERVKRYRGAALGATVLPMLGVQPVLGRGFTEEDDRPGAAPVVLLGHAAWRDDFGASAEVVGRTVRVNGETGTVIGVMPETFGFPYRQEVWLPRRLLAGDGFNTQLIARLKPGVGVAQAGDELAAVAHALGMDLKAHRDDRRLTLKPWAFGFITESTRQIVWMMFATGALVLLLACVNVANLQLSQILLRRRELAVRSALGAGRGRLLRELLAESLILSVIATAVALVFAELAARWLVSVFAAADGAPPYYIDLGIDLRMLGFAALAAFAATLLAGWVPALRASRTDVQDALRHGDKGASAGGFARFAKGLVVAEIALTVVLLVGAGMFVRGVHGVLAFDYGTRADPARIAVGQLALSAEQYPAGADRVRFFERVVDRLHADPQVESASAATALPGWASAGPIPVAAEGQARPARGYRRANLAHVDDHFLRTHDVPLLSGRGLDGRDGAGGEPVAVIDARLAQALWPAQEALGRYLLLRPGGGDAQRVTVVGVVAPLHLESASDPVRPSLLLPLRQHPQRSAVLAVRTRGPADAFAPRLAEAVRGEDADTPVYAQRTQRTAMEMGRIGPVILTQIFTAVGALALLLAAAGLYGVLAFAVAQRTREIGIRRAIGAGRAGVMALVGRRVLWQLALGLGIGIALAVPWSGLLSGSMHYTRGYDPALFAVVVAVIALAALAAAAPLRRALRVDPIIALRHE